MTVLLVQGMQGAPCRDALMDALLGVPGVVEVDVNLFRAVAVVIHHGACDERRLISAASSKGFIARAAPRRSGKESA